MTLIRTCAEYLGAWLAVSTVAMLLAGRWLRGASNTRRQPDGGEAR